MLRISVSPALSGVSDRKPLQAKPHLGFGLRAQIESGYPSVRSPSLVPHIWGGRRRLQQFVGADRQAYDFPIGLGLIEQAQIIIWGPALILAHTLLGFLIMLIGSYPPNPYSNYSEHFMRTRIRPTHPKFSPGSPQSLYHLHRTILDSWLPA